MLDSVTSYNKSMYRPVGNDVRFQILMGMPARGGVLQAAVSHTWAIMSCIDVNKVGQVKSLGPPRDMTLVC